MKRIILLSVFFLSPAMAQDRLKEAIFHRYDRNGDEVVSSSELPDAATRAKFDRDGDGDVTLAEYRETVGIKAEPGESNPGEKNAAAVKRLDAYVKEADKDGDGRLSKAETGGAEWFARIDRNKNGFIDATEVETVRGLVKRFGDRILPSAPEETVSEEEIAKITSGPEILKPGDVGIGRKVEDFSFKGLVGRTHQLSEVRDHKAVVFAMTSATCPVSKRLLPALADLQPELARQGIPLVLVNSFSSESVEQIKEQLESVSFEGTYVHDTDLSVAKALDATTTTEVFLIDSRQTLHYRGALNDQYGIDYSIDAPRVNYLEEAVAAFLEGIAPTIAATAAPGCELDLGERKGEAVGDLITYHRDVSRILQRNCVQCHHDGGIAPFALDDFEEVSDRARVIKRVVDEGTMPPWFAAPAKDGENPWANDHSLSTQEKETLLAWLESKDQPVGDPADAPLPLSFPDEWTMGEPDLVVPISKAYEIKATGFMPYQRDVVETTLTEDKWVTGYEILPSERDVVHHVIVQVFEKGATVRDRGEATGYWAAYVPGNGAVRYPEGFARKFPAGAKVHFQIHYTPSGTAKKERLKMGLHFADSPPQYEVKTIGVADRRLNIPPGAESHVESTTRGVPFDIPALGFMAHMHVRGKAFTYELIHPDGTTEMLLDIPRYDFNWQLRYELKEPKMLPKGSQVKVTGVFDNSEKNKANPDPGKTVKWGDQTYDEMLIGYVEYFVPVGEGEKVAAAE
ncbi:MAG: redoxin domain-containing protein [Verrucomicrobiales bacterium]|nr:redoxin domain-containing protein [Verrucomicrobiales bacterium]